MLSLLWTLIVGFFVGLLARFLHPGDDPMGLLMTTALGIVGSLLAAYLGQLIGLYQAGKGAGFIASTIGAILVLVIYGLLRRYSKKSD